MPVYTLKLDVWVVDLEGETKSFVEINVGSFDGVHIFSSRLKLVEVKILWEYFHFIIIQLINKNKYL